MKRPKPIICEKLPPPKTPAQCALIALSEFSYWRKSKASDEITIGATAAAANIYAAISSGLYAEWHPKPKTKKGKI